MNRTSFDNRSISPIPVKKVRMRFQISGRGTYFAHGEWKNRHMMMPAEHRHAMLAETLTPIATRKNYVIHIKSTSVVVHYLYISVLKSCLPQLRTKRLI